MSKSFVTGFPRIGEQRELKFALESFWAGKTSFGEVEKVAAELKKRHWNYQIDAKVDLISVNDFSYYDLMLDNIVTFGDLHALLDLVVMIYTSQWLEEMQIA